MTWMVPWVWFKITNIKNKLLVSPTIYPNLQ